MPTTAPSSTLDPMFTEVDYTLLKDYLECYKNVTSLHGPAKKQACKKVLMAAQEALKCS
jgi:hypothetical protein